jgi:uncharacterized protein (TIGR02001 family)
MRWLLVGVLATLIFPVVAGAQQAGAQQAGAQQAGAQQAGAQQESAFYITGDVGVLSDYVYRGNSRSVRNVAGQANLTINHDNGFYAGVFGSTLSGGNFEKEIYVGWGGSLDAYDYNLSLAYDSFDTEAYDADYVELRASLARDYGLLYIKLGTDAAFDDREFGGGGSVYLYSDAEVPLPNPVELPITLSLHLGYEDFAQNITKWDWGVGLYVEVVGFEFGVRYQDADFYGIRPANQLGRLAGQPNRVVFSIKRYF